MKKARIEEENQRQIARQREFRLAADVLAEAWMAYAEVHAIAVIGSVARPLWKEVPRFSDFRRHGIEIWHECGDLDMALWIDSQDRLHELRRAGAQALRSARETDSGMSVSDFQLDIFLFEPRTDRYLGRLCKFAQCPKGKPPCQVPGCGEIPFNKKIDGFSPRSDLLAPAAHAMLYERGTGRLRSALDLPTVDQAPAPRAGA